MARKSRVNDDNEEFEGFISQSFNENKKIIEKFIPNTLKIKALNGSQEELIRSIKKNDITICAGHPGSGKTFIALTQALNLIRKMESQYNKIYLIKSVIPLKGEEIGFLKGDYMEKIEPYMQSYYINIEKIIPKQSLTTLLSYEIIKPFPVAFLRGVSIDNSIIIVDETQNLSMSNIKTVMTRLSSSSKMIILGDINQIDLKNKNESSLEKLLDMFDKKVDKIGVVRMSESDENIRNPIIKEIEKIFKINEENNEY